MIFTPYIPNLRFLMLMKHRTCLLLLLLVILMPSCDRQKTSTPPTKPNNPPIKVVASDIFREFKENEVAANYKYKDKILAVTGKISELVDRETYLVISLQVNGDSAYDYKTIFCNFDPEFKEQFLVLKRGQIVTVVGRCDPSYWYSYITLNECSSFNILAK